MLGYIQWLDYSLSGYADQRQIPAIELYGYTETPYLKMASRASGNLGLSKDDENYHRNLRHDGQGNFFAPTHSPRRQYFTIHPEWASENPTYKQKTATFPPRRCRSAPPAFKARNPITWENPDVADKR